jgi:hypothetical protein
MKIEDLAKGWLQKQMEEVKTLPPPPNNVVSMAEWLAKKKHDAHLGAQGE